MAISLMDPEVLWVLNGVIPAIDAVRCACGMWMMPKSPGEPCDACREEIFDEEMQDAMRHAAEQEEADDYYAQPSHRRDPSHPVYGYVAC